MENWEKIEEFPNYSVGDLGHVRNDNTGRLVATRRNTTRVYYVGLSQDGVANNRTVGRLVATAFVENPRPEFFDTVIQKDGDRSNNRADNLVWRPKWFAVMYANQFKRPAYDDSNPVIDVDTGDIYTSAWDAAIANGLLVNDLNLSIFNRTYLFPTYQTFRFLPQE